MITLQEALRAVFYSPFYAAIERKAFAAEGVEVQFVSSPSPGQALVGLMDGSVDVGWGGPMRTNLGWHEMPGCDVVCFGEVVTRDPFFLMVKGERGAYSPEALAGLRVGSVSEVPTPWLCLQHDVRLEGMDPGVVHRVAGQTMPQNVAALLAGTIDVAQVFQPYAEELVEQGCTVWHAQAERGPCSYTTFYARRSVIEAKRAELEPMVRGLYRTLQWVHSVDGAALAAVVAGYFPDVPHARLAAALERYKRLGIWGQNPVLPRGGYDRLRDSLVSGGLVPKGVPYELAVDNSLAEAAVRAG